MARHKTKDTDNIPFETEIVKLVPEDTDESKQSIEEAAYYIGMNRRQHGHSGDELNDWFQAEKAVKENLD